MKSALYLSLRLHIIFIVMNKFDKYFQIIIIAEDRIEFNDLRNILSHELNTRVKIIATLKNFDFSSQQQKKFIFINTKDDTIGEWDKLKDDTKNNCYFFMISAKKKIPNDFIQLVTPFKLNDLILKIKSILKVEVIKSEEKSINNYIYSYQSSTMRDKKSAKIINLTEMENKFIYFLSNNNNPVRKKEILSQVWGYNFELDTHTLESLVYRLRKKLEFDPQNPAIIMFEKNKYYLNFKV